MRLVPLSRLLPDGRPPDALIAEGGGHAHCFAQFAADVAGNAEDLARRECRIGLLLAEDGYWFLVGMMALLQIGAAIVLPPNAQPGTLAALRDAADLVVCDRPVADAAEFRLAPAARGGGFALRRLDPQAARLEFFTSGSTGERKRITKTLAQLETEIAVLEGLWGERIGDASFHGTAGHQHIFGLTFRLLWPAMTGRRFAPATHFAWESLLAAQSAPAVLVVSPAHLSRLGGIPKLPAERRPRAIFTAGAPLPQAAAAEAEAVLGSLPIEIFGSTETGAIAWRRQVEANALWQPLPGVKIAVAPAGTLELTSPFLPRDAVHAGADLIELAQGGFRFCGRADRICKIAGKRVSLAEIERDLAAHPWLEDAVALALGSARDVLAVMAVPSPAGARALAELGKFRFERKLRAALATTQDPGALPRRWRFVAAIPTDAMGKRPLALLERQFGEVERGTA